MKKINLLNKIKDIYSNGGNIISHLKQIDNSSSNSIEDILISYDFQAGSYYNSYKQDPHLKNQIGEKIANLINGLGEFKSIIEIGVGEATTLGIVLSKLDNKSIKSYGFDLSWSRIKYAKRFITELELKDVELFTSDLFRIPLKDNSIDIVYTNHSIEPNGGKEKEALKELYRITNKYLILLEPSFELANEQARERMKGHGYVTKLYSTAKRLGFDIVEHRLFEPCVNALNPTGLILVKKDSTHSEDSPLCCPLTRTNLAREENLYFSKDSLLAYPIIDGIPCLLPQNAIVATKYKE